MEKRFVIGRKNYSIKTIIAFMNIGQFDFLSDFSLREILRQVVTAVSLLPQHW